MDVRPSLVKSKTTGRAPRSGSLSWSRSWLLLLTERLSHQRREQCPHRLDRKRLLARRRVVGHVRAERPHGRSRSLVALAPEEHVSDLRRERDLPARTAVPAEGDASVVAF